jgi:hypothetical protein
MIKSNHPMSLLPKTDSRALNTAQQQKLRLAKQLLQKAFGLPPDYEWVNREAKYEFLLLQSTVSEIYSVYLLYTMNKELRHKLPPSLNSLLRRFGEVKSSARRCFGDRI